jgi:hypothetical protein
MLGQLPAQALDPPLRLRTLGKHRKWRFASRFCP